MAKKKKEQILDEEVKMDVVHQTIEETPEIVVETTEDSLKKEIDNEFIIETEDVMELILDDVVEEHSIVEESKKVKEDVDISKLSMVDKRFYQRTGRLRKNI